MRVIFAEKNKIRTHGEEVNYGLEKADAAYCDGDWN